MKVERKTQNKFVPDGHSIGLLSSPPNVAVALMQMLGLSKAIITGFYKTSSLWNGYDIWN